MIIKQYKGIMKKPFESAYLIQKCSTMIKSYLRLPSVIVLALLAFSGSCSAQMNDYFTDDALGNPIGTLQHPSGEYYKGVTYLAYQGPLEDPYVCAYDHTTGKWTGPIKAGISLMGKIVDGKPPKKIDNHGKPALVIDSQGYIHLMFGGHGGHYSLGRNLYGRPGGGRQTHVVSRKPEDISEWEVLDNVSPFGTYNQFVKMDNGDIYLFYRHGSHRSDWVYQKSTDDCRTFGPEVPILKHKAREENPNVYDTWYAWFTKGQGNTIIATYNYHPCRVTGHTKARYNGYYMLMDCKDGKWWNVAGEKLTTPVTKEDADKKTLVYDTGEEQSRRGTCLMDEEGNPHVTLKLGSPSRVHYYRWTGDSWLGPVNVTGLSQSQDGDMLCESPDVIRILLNAKDSGVGEVAWWETADGGLTWKKGDSLIRRPGNGFTITAMIRNAHPDARIMANESRGVGNSQLKKIFLLGDHGPVRRAEKETRNPGD